MAEKKKLKTENQDKSWIGMQQKGGHLWPPFVNGTASKDWVQGEIQVKIGVTLQ